MLQFFGMMVANAGVPVALPPSEDPVQWSSALVLAGLEPMAAEPEGAAAWIREVGGEWSVRVRDASDGEHLLSVSVPTDQAARESLALLLASLATPLGTPPLAPAVRPPPRLASPRETSEPEAGTESEEPVETLRGPSDRPQETPTAVGIPIRPWPPLTVWRRDVPQAFQSGPSSVGSMASDALPPFWAAASPVLRLRSDVRSVAGGQAWVGYRPAALRPLKVAVGGQLSPSALIVRVAGSPRRMQTTLLGAGAWLEVRGFEAGPVVALSRRRFTEEGQEPIVTWLPVVGVRGAYAVEVGSLTVPLSVEVWYDVIRTELLVGGLFQGDLPRVGITLSAGIGSR